jgi:small-conductance mechanosensitive channel
VRLSTSHGPSTNVRNILWSNDCIAITTGDVMHIVRHQYPHLMVTQPKWETFHKQDNYCNYCHYYWWCRGIVRLLNQSRKYCVIIWFIVNITSDVMNIETLHAYYSTLNHKVVTRMVNQILRLAMYKERERNEWQEYETSSIYIYRYFIYLLLLIFGCINMYIFSILQLIAII